MFPACVCRRQPLSHWHVRPNLSQCTAVGGAFRFISLLLCRPVRAHVGCVPRACTTAAAVAGSEGLLPPDGLLMGVGMQVCHQGRHRPYMIKSCSSCCSAATLLAQHHSWLAAVGRCNTALQGRGRLQVASGGSGMQGGTLSRGLRIPHNTASQFLITVGVQPNKAGR